MNKWKKILLSLFFGVAVLITSTTLLSENNGECINCINCLCINCVGECDETDNKYLGQSSYSFDRQDLQNIENSTITDLQNSNNITLSVPQNGDDMTITDLQKINSVGSFNGSFQSNLSHNINTLKGEGTEVILTSEKLRLTLLNLLGKSSGAKLYSNDFLLHDDYKSTTTVNEETGVSTTTANNYSLDLRGSGITDITELVLFEFPQTLQAINLSDCTITNGDITKIIDFTTYNSLQTITYGGKSLIVKSNLSDIIKKINLNFNQINLSTLSSVQLNNTKIIYGIQRLNNLHSSKLILHEEVESADYYIRENDVNFLSFNFERNGLDVGYTQNEITKLAFDGSLGDYKVKVTGLPDTESSYFKGYIHEVSFTLFTCIIDPTFTVERLSLFVLPIDKIIINGIYDDKVISYYNGSTNQTGTFVVNIYIQVGSSIRILQRDYNVVDTTPPTITLIGQSLVYTRQNRKFNDPGYAGNDSGEDITSSITIESNLDITKLGSYIITYSLVDKAGNVAVSKNRTVVVQVQVLDTTILTSNTEKFVAGWDIILEVKPDDGIPIANYKNFVYNWYLDNRLIDTTTGDSITGKSSITLKIDKTSSKDVYVVLKAVQKVDDQKVEVRSQTLYLEIEPSFRNNNTLILATGISISIIIIILVAVTIVKYKKASKGVAKRVKKATIGIPAKDPGIQVIKNYNSDDNSGGNKSGSGGNSNFRPMEKRDEQDKNNK